MTQPLRFCLVLHNHQPIGNFDGVFEQAYQDSYRPFLDVFEPFESLRISLHTSGPLMEWLAIHHPEYIDRLAHLVQANRIEILGGAYYEPILTMIPSRDRIGQITSYSDWLENRLGAKVQGMWVPERVWEQTLTSDISRAGMRYTVLDDFHFRNAGLESDQLYGHYLTEDEGNLLNIFPGSERLRYLIPFADPQETVDYLGQINERHPSPVVVFGDDGEKFGTWPETNQHVYGDGWLQRFFETLANNQHWLQTTTLAEAFTNTHPLGRTYLPDASYREMTEWALPVNQQLVYDRMVHDMEHDDRWEVMKRFVRGGFWRNFKAKYPESNEMYARMMQVSKRLERASQNHGRDELHFARQALYRGQCNCSYWHGAFGGIYLPHLRNAVFNQLIAADNLLDQVEGNTGPRIEAVADDFNFDSRSEVRLTNDQLSMFIAPASGGQIYELDVRSICHNLLATLARRPEAYHRKVLAGASGSQDDVASIHDRVVFKQAELDQRIQYDTEPPKSFLERFYETDAAFESVLAGEVADLGDFIQGVFETKIRRNPDRIQVQLVRDGIVAGHPVKMTKGITAESGSSVLDIAYLLENLPANRDFRFVSQWNLAGLPADAEDRYFFQGDHQHGHLGSNLQLDGASELGLADEWLGIRVQLEMDHPTGFWTYPIQSVSQSEGGFELVHQSVCVLPNWHVRADEQGRWSTTFRVNVDTQLAESRMRSEGEVCGAGADR